jgi:hypothetical protein
LSLGNGATVSSVRGMRKLQRVLVGNVNPKWKIQCSVGANATTSMDATFVNCVCDPVNAYIVINGTPPQTSVIQGRVSLVENPVGTPSSMTGELSQDRAMSSFLKQVHSLVTESQGLIILGELHKTLHMLRKPAEALQQKMGEYLRKVKQSKNAHPRTWKKTIADSYLEGVYGWSPFVQDVAGVLKAYKRRGEIPHVSPCHGFGSNFGFQSQSDITRTYSGPLALAHHYRRKESSYSKIRGAVWTQAQTTGFDSDLYGFNFREFIPTAWELLPWSFLADYFSNIGDILENVITSTTDVRWAECSTTVETLEEYMSVLDVPYMKSILGSSLLKYSQGSPGYLQYQQKKISRFPITPYVPLLALEMPGLTKHYLNMAALFTSASSIHQQTPRRWR